MASKHNRFQFNNMKECFIIPFPWFFFWEWNMFVQTPPPRKCSKLNHTASPFSTLLPSFLRFGFGSYPLVDMCVDDTRKILYTLSESSCISVYDLGNRLIYEIIWLQLDNLIFSPILLSTLFSLLSSLGGCLELYDL